MFPLHPLPFPSSQFLTLQPSPTPLHPSLTFFTPLQAPSTLSNPLHPSPSPFTPLQPPLPLSNPLHSSPTSFTPLQPLHLSPTPFTPHQSPKNMLQEVVDRDQKLPMEVTLVGNYISLQLLQLNIEDSH